MGVEDGGLAVDEAGQRVMVRGVDKGQEALGGLADDGGDDHALCASRAGDYEVAVDS
jgi:hypothetical protein